jgi:hypothetical protein
MNKLYTEIYTYLLVVCMAVTGNTNYGTVYTSTQDCVGGEHTVYGNFKNICCIKATVQQDRSG